MSGKSNKTADLEKQIDAAIEAGMIPNEVPKAAPAKKRGRPAGKSVERPLQTPTMLTPEEKKLENDKKVQAAIGSVKKRQLISKLRAFAAYFPATAREAVQTIVLEELEVDQLQLLYDTFRDNVLGEEEIIFLPATIKKILGKTEDTLVGIGMTNPDHPTLGEFLKFQGLAQRIEQDESIDKNVKLIAVEMSGKLPRNPYLNIAAGIFTCAWDCYNQATYNRIREEPISDPKYSKLRKNKN